MVNEEKQLEIYPTPKGALLANEFKVFVRIAGEEKWEEVSCYEVKVDMHRVRKASMAYFDFQGKVEVKIQYFRMNIYRVDVRPLSKRIHADFSEREVHLSLEKPEKLSIEINGDRFHNLHLFAGSVEENKPEVNSDIVKYLPGNLQKASIYRMEELVHELEKMPKGRTLYFGPGIHYIEECVMRVPSDTNIYIAGGAVVVGTFVCSKVKNIKIYGRGSLYLANFERFSGLNGVRLSHAENVTIQGINFINPPHYTVYIGGSNNVTIKDIKTFSCEGWSDGIDMMSSQNVTVRDCFLRTSDDCIAVYGRRWDYNGDTRNINVEGCILWADVAHPTMIGTHGDYYNEGNVIEDVEFKNIDILEHHEAQINYLGCMAINVGDKNTARNIRYQNIRVEQFEHGKLFDIQVKFNKDYNPAPGNRIENIYFKDIFYDGTGEESSTIKGFDEERKVTGVIFENLVIRGKHILSAPSGNIEIKEFAENIVFK